MPAAAILLPKGTERRDHATRFAAQLYCYGDPSQRHGQPIRGLTALAKITGMTESGISRAMKEDQWEQFALGLAKQNNLGKLATLPTVEDRLIKLNSRADGLMVDYLATDSGSEEAIIALNELERVLKLVGHDKVLALQAKIEERIRLDALKADQEGSKGNGDNAKVLDVD